jgi:hypothetical protein
MESPGPRLSHIDRELVALSKIEAWRRTEAWYNVADLWLDKRLDMTRPFRNRPAPVIPGRS